ncbi:MAG: aldehyde dehydrogenase family protein [Oscillospiraceae bacterium]|nr:aldehyde dehydrogenase family protein [Oscillospiraceae bacterium]
MKIQTPTGMEVFMRAYTKQYINGQWVEGFGESVLTNCNAYTGEALYSYRSASPADVDAAYEAAEAAQKQWGKLRPDEQQAVLERLLEAFDYYKDDIFDVLSTEAGCTVAKCAYEYATCKDFVKEVMSFPHMMEGKIQPSVTPGKANYVFKMPKGVIGVIAPWNVPLVLSIRSVLPAIATGNAVVLKPASNTPGSAFLLAEIFERAGIPAGLFNVIAGRGSEIGDYFVAHPIPRLISFTGSTEVGRRIGELACGHLKDVSLELGGNNVMLVLADADIKRAAAAAKFGGYFNQGQVCMGINRVICVKEVYADFIEALKEELKDVKVGDPRDPEVFVGPIIDDIQRRHVEDCIAGSIAAGCTVALEGKTVGNCIYPWILSDVTMDMPTANCEVFGPVVSVIRAEDEDDAIAIANDTDYGLSGSVFTRDLYHGIQVAKRIDTGMVHVNDQSINDEPNVMFGGVKQSGIGRFNGKWVIDKFTTDHWISVQEEYRF